MEIVTGADPSVAAASETFLRSFALVPLDQTVARRAVASHRLHRMKLPDAIIWASAQAADALRVTRNTKDFPPGDPGVRMPSLRS